MSEKRTMQYARSNCAMTCGVCGEQFKSKYGIMDGQVFCPRCHNMYLVKSLADTRYISQLRKNRTLLRLICFIISVACLVLAIIFKEDTLLFSIAVVFCAIIGFFPFYRCFGAFVTKGFMGFIKEESTIIRDTPIYYKNGIIDDNEGGFFRFIFYIVDFILVWPAIALLYITVIPRAFVDLFRIGRAKKKINEGFEKLLPPDEGLQSDRYNFEVRFSDSYNKICIEYYMKWKNVKEEQAIQALEKNLRFTLRRNLPYKDGYKFFLDRYYGRSDYEGKRFVFLDVTPVGQEIFTKEKKKKKRSNKK